jgi:hypothetical protein
MCSIHRHIPSFATSSKVGSVQRTELTVLNTRLLRPNRKPGGKGYLALTENFFKICLEWVGLPQSRRSLIWTLKILSSIMRQTSMCRPHSHSREKRLLVSSCISAMYQRGYLCTDFREILWSGLPIRRETPNLANIEQYPGILNKVLLKLIRFSTKQEHSVINLVQYPWVRSC